MFWRVWNQFEFLREIHEFKKFSRRASYVMTEWLTTVRNDGNSYLYRKYFYVFLLQKMIIRVHDAYSKTCLYVYAIFCTIVSYKSEICMKKVAS